MAMFRLFVPPVAAPREEVLIEDGLGEVFPRDRRDNGPIKTPAVAVTTAGEKLIRGLRA
jgi:hypothetical protein